MLYEYLIEATVEHSLRLDRSGLSRVCSCAACFFQTELLGYLLALFPRSFHRPRHRRKIRKQRWRITRGGDRVRPRRGYRREVLARAGKPIDDYSGTAAALRELEGGGARRSAEENEPVRRDMMISMAAAVGISISKPAFCKVNAETSPSILRKTARCSRRYFSTFTFVLRSSSGVWGSL